MGREVKQGKDQDRFYIDIDDEQAELVYREVDQQTLDLRHTYVPKEARGRGLGAQLVSFALEHARKKGYKVMPTCSFVESYIEKHPEYRDLVK